MKNTLSARLLFSFLIGFGQNKEKLQSEALKMYEFTMNSEYDSLMNYTYPKLFNFVSKEKLITEMNKAFDNNDFKISILKQKPNFYFGEILELNGNYYALIEHDIKMNLAFKEPAEEDELNLMVDLFKTVMKTDSVKVKDNSITIKKRSEMIAISEGEYNHKWYFLNNDQNSFLLNALIPENVQEKLGIKE